MTAIRTVPWATMGMTLIDGRAASTRRKYSPTVVQSTLMPYCRARSSTSLRASPTAGARPMPQFGKTCVVTPWRTALSAFGFTSSVMSECVCTSTKPGETTRPFASIVAFAFSPSSPPMCEMVSRVRPTSARYAGRPEPSAMRPPRMITSNMAGPRPRRSSEAEAHLSEALPSHAGRFVGECVEAFGDPSNEVRGQRCADTSDRRVALVDEADHDVVLAAVLHAVNGLELDRERSLQPAGRLRRTAFVELGDRLHATQLDLQLGHERGAPIDIPSLRAC